MVGSSMCRVDMHILFSLEQTGLFESSPISRLLLRTSNRTAFDPIFLYILSGAFMQRRFIFYFLSEG